MMLREECKAIVLLGNGNVGSHLSRILNEIEGYRLLYHYYRGEGRSIDDVPRDADIYLFALTDTALEQVWSQMPTTTGVWMHTSGSVPLDAMYPYHELCAVLYPLQTFSRGRALDWKQIPIYYEGHAEAKALAEALSERVQYADSLGRRKLHLAAVLACNYSNYLVSLAEEYLLQEGFDPKALIPLLRETFAKLEVLPAVEAQTGPAIRGDRAIVEKHKAMLEGETLQVYTLLSNALLRRAEERDLNSGSSVN